MLRSYSSKADFSLAWVPPASPLLSSAARVCLGKRRISRETMTLASLRQSWTCHSPFRSRVAIELGGAGWGAGEGGGGGCLYAWEEERPPRAPLFSTPVSFVCQASGHEGMVWHLLISQTWCRDIYERIQSSSTPAMQSCYHDVRTKDSLIFTSNDHHFLILIKTACYSGCRSAGCIGMA